MADKDKTSITVVANIKPEEKAPAATSTSSQHSAGIPFNVGNNVLARYYVQYEHELITVNKTVKTDGFSSVYFENIGECDCILFGGIPLSPKDKTREYLNRPGEVITTQIPVMFQGDSTNRKVLVTKVYYEPAK